MSPPATWKTTKPPIHRMTSNMAMARNGPNLINILTKEHRLPGKGYDFVKLETIGASLED